MHKRDLNITSSNGELWITITYGENSHNIKVNLPTKTMTIYRFRKILHKEVRAALEEIIKEISYENK